MQMYDGLPIITNKITVEEQRNIPHHLLGVVGLDQQPWRVGVFKRKAENAIREIRSRGRLPILVGGTHYYTQSLLFKDVLVTDPAESEENGNNLSRQEINQRYSILERPTNEILEELRRVDPIMADRWHPHDRRKIQRSLEIYLMTGKLASKVYEEQRERKRLQSEGGGVNTNESAEHEDVPLIQSTVIFWVHAESEILKTRLDARVDKMVQEGLINEVTALDTLIRKQTAAGSEVDRSSGIWVSIGYKEFEPYLTALGSGTVSRKDLEVLLTAAIEKTKAATRQYAKRQVRWIRLKLLAALFNTNALQNIYLLDGSNLDHWSDVVSTPAINVTRKFLAQEKLPAPIDLSPAAHELLNPKQEVEFCDHPELWIRRACELCNITAVTENQWQIHIKSRSHRRGVKKANRNATNGRQQTQNKGSAAGEE